MTPVSIEVKTSAQTRVTFYLEEVCSKLGIAYSPVIDYCLSIGLKDDRRTVEFLLETHNVEKSPKT